MLYFVFLLKWFSFVEFEKLKPLQKELLVLEEYLFFYIEAITMDNINTEPIGLLVGPIDS